MTSLLPAEKQLRYALEAFAYAHNLGPGWAILYYNHLVEAGIDSMNDLGTGKRTVFAT
jgi:hypothetical protein